jgi:hypothetical protein
MKKLLLSFKLHRNNRMRVFVEVAAPSILFELTKITRNEIDGFLVNLELFASNIIGRSEIIPKDHEILDNALKTIKQNNHSGLPVYVLMKPDLSLVDLIWSSGLPVQGFIFREGIDQATLIKLKKLEGKRNLVSKKQDDLAFVFNKVEGTGSDTSNASGMRETVREDEKGKRGRKIKLLFGNK